MPFARAHESIACGTRPINNANVLTRSNLTAFCRALRFTETGQCALASLSQKARVPFDPRRACNTALAARCHESQAVKLESGLLSNNRDRKDRRKALVMFELSLLLAHSQRWNLTSLILIPLDLVGLVASLWMILGAIKGILNPSEVSRKRAARRASHPAGSQPQLLNALLAKKPVALASTRLVPGSVTFPRNRQLNRFS